MGELLTKLGTVVAGGLAISLLLAVLWHAFWTVTVPGAFPNLMWEGYDAWTKPIVLLSWPIVTGMGLRTLFRS